MLLQKFACLNDDGLTSGDVMEREGRGGARQKLNVDPLNGLQVWQGGENVAIGQADAGRDEIKRLNMLDTDALRSEVCFQCASNGSGSNHRRPSRGAAMDAIRQIPREIGRTSCRERVCHYVYNP